MDNQHGALSRCDLASQKIFHGLSGIVDVEAVKIHMALNGKITAVQAIGQIRTDVLNLGFDILRCKGDHKTFSMLHKLF